MKSLEFLLVGICVSIIKIEAIDINKIEEMAMVALNECKTIEGGTDEDFKALMEDLFPETRTAHCMVACMNEKFGIFKDGKFNDESFMEMAKMLTENHPTLMEGAAEISKVCGAATADETDRCESAVGFELCLHKIVKEKKLDVHFF